MTNSGKVHKLYYEFWKLPAVPDISCRAEEKFNTYIFIRQRLRTERVGNQASERERLSPAESSLRKEIFEVPPGADQAN